MSKTYAQIATEATDAENTAKRGRQLFEDSYQEWCITACLDKRENKTIAADMAKSAGDWKIATGEDSVALYKIAGLVFSGTGDPAVFGGKTVVSRPGGNSAVGLDDHEVSLWTAIQSLRRAGRTDSVGVPQVTKNVVGAGDTKQERAAAVFALVVARDKAESEAKTAADAAQVAQAAIAESNEVARKKREASVLAYLKAAEGSLTRAADRKDTNGDAIDLGGTQTEVVAQGQRLIALIQRAIAVQ